MWIILHVLGIKTLNKYIQMLWILWTICFIYYIIYWM